jgi:hypothetical protein
MRPFAAGLLFFVLLPAAVSAAEPEWLPPAGEEAIARQLAERLKEVAGGKAADEAAVLEQARTEVRRLRGRLQSWGRQGIADRAPDLSKLELPAGGDPTLDTLAPYHLCAGLLLLTHVNRLDPDPQARLATARALSGIQMAMFALVHSFMAKGTEAQLEGFLTGPPLEAVWNRIQDHEPTRDYAARQCQPVLSAMLAE